LAAHLLHEILHKILVDLAKLSTLSSFLQGSAILLHLIMQKNVHYHGYTLNDGPALAGDVSTKS
jgi:hypothetical protein